MRSVLLLLSLSAMVSGFAAPVVRRPFESGRPYTVLFKKPLSCFSARSAIWKSGFTLYCDKQKEKRVAFSLMHYGSDLEQSRSVKLAMKAPLVQAVGPQRTYTVPQQGDAPLVKRK